MATQDLLRGLYHPCCRPGTRPVARVEAYSDRAARTGRAHRDVIEGALRRYLGLETTVRRVQARGDLDEDESLALAYRELDAYRAERAKAM
jgi:hypothetical protein